jgi:hypothetical protein
MITSYFFNIPWVAAVQEVNVDGRVRRHVAVDVQPKNHDQEGNACSTTASAIPVFWAAVAMTSGLGSSARQHTQHECNNGNGHGHANITLMVVKVQLRLARDGARPLDTLKLLRNGHFSAL